MAVSPIVNSFMQGPEEAQQPTSAEQIFKNQFSDMAFNALRAKFPALINQIITLKHMAGDVEKGTAFGVFVIQSGNELVYVPVVMSDGSIVSCEMMYDKEADQFYPLDSHTVKEILAKSQSSDPVLLQNNPRVEDTRRLFQEMIRPPSSSNVVLAGNREGIRGFPKIAREAVAGYLEKNPGLLGKIASFYPVQELALKLAYSEPEKPCPVQEASFIRKDALTKEAAAKLTKDEKKQILKSGWLVKKADEAPVAVIPKEKLKPALENELNLTLYKPACLPGHDNRVGTGKVLTADEKGIAFEPVIIYGNLLFTGTGQEIRLDDTAGVLLADINFDNPNISGFGCATRLSGLRKNLQGDEFNLINIYVLVPARNGRWLKFPQHIVDRSNSVNITENRLAYHDNAIQLSPNLSAGYVSSPDDVLEPSRFIAPFPVARTYFVPENTLFVVRNRGAKKSIAPISSWEKLAELMKIFGSEIQVADNGAGLDINTNEKTASFASQTDAAEWLHGKFGMNALQIDTVLANPRTLVFEKKALSIPLLLYHYGVSIWHVGCYSSPYRRLA